MRFKQISYQVINYEKRNLFHISQKSGFLPYFLLLIESKLKVKKQMHEWLGYFTLEKTHILIPLGNEKARLSFKKERLRRAVWPDKNRQMSIKVAQNDFTRKMNDFDTYTKIA